MTFLTLLIAKTAAAVLNLLGRGATSLPGRIAVSLKQDILSVLSRGVRIICVTGTNGKTTTCALIEQGLKSNGKSYFVNRGGANMLGGVVSAFIANSTVFGKCKKDFAVLECDENSFPIIARYIDADCVAITNIFRDQLDRYGEVSTTLSKILAAVELMPNATLCLNADCPLTYSLSLHCKNKTVTYGVGADLKNNTIVDNRACPKCGNALDYRSVVYSQLGDYVCRSCGYSRPNPDYCITDIMELDELGSRFMINSHLVRLSLGGIYNVYNFCTAVCVLGVFGINNVSAVCDYGGAFGRMEHFKCGSRDVLLMLVKNPVGLSSCINYVSKMQGNPAIVFALNDNAADGRDVSWIWDSSFYPLSDFDEFYTIGKRSLDMAVRLKYDGIRCAALDGECYEKLMDIIKSSNKNFVIMSTYTSMMNMRPDFVGNFGGREFWK